MPERQEADLLHSGAAYRRSRSSSAGKAQRHGPPRHRRCKAARTVQTPSNRQSRRPAWVDFPSITPRCRWSASHSAPESSARIFQPTPSWGAGEVERSGFETKRRRRRERNEVIQEIVGLRWGPGVATSPTFFSVTCYVATLLAMTRRVASRLAMTIGSNRAGSNLRRRSAAGAWTASSPWLGGRAERLPRSASADGRPAPMAAEATASAARTKHVQGPCGPALCRLVLRLPRADRACRPATRRRPPRRPGKQMPAADCVAPA